MFLFLLLAVANSDRLAIMIPTRGRTVSYLQNTLETWQKVDRVETRWTEVDVYVFNNGGISNYACSSHGSFYWSKNKFPEFVFVENGCTEFFSRRGQNGDGEIFEQESRKAQAEALAKALAWMQMANATHIAIWDDDSSACPDLLPVVSAMTFRVKNWGYLHVGLGGSGMFFEASRLRNLTEYVANRVGTANADILVWEFFLRSRLPSYRFSRILASHDGAITSFIGERSGANVTKTKCCAPLVHSFGSYCEDELAQFGWYRALTEISMYTIISCFEGWPF
jgi:hypothetical protein